MNSRRVEDDVVRGLAVYDVELGLQVDAFVEGWQGNVSDGLLRFCAETNQAFFVFEENVGWTSTVDKHAL